MYYITNIESETGQKLNKVLDEINRCRIASIKFLSQMRGSRRFLEDPYNAAGGIVAVEFPTNPDAKKWRHLRKKRGFYAPNKKYKGGKELQAQIDDLPKVSNQKINEAIGYDSMWNRPGLAKNGFHIGIEVNHEWEVQMPSDCKEVTQTEYLTFFP